MTLLVLGIAHHSASLATLERVTVSRAGSTELITQLLDHASISETFVVSTCNRIEIYAVATDPDAATALVTQVLSERAGITPGALLSSAFVHHNDAAIRHLFEVAGGLDSLVVGDEQILGQVRAAYAAATAIGAIGSVLHPLIQRALRVGKQIRTDTGLTRAGASMVSVALAAIAAALPTSGLSGRHAVVLVLQRHFMVDDGAYGGGPRDGGAEPAARADRAAVRAS